MRVALALSAEFSRLSLRTLHRLERISAEVLGAFKRGMRV